MEGWARNFVLQVWSGSAYSCSLREAGYTLLEPKEKLQGSKAFNNDKDTIQGIIIDGLLINKSCHIQLTISKLELTWGYKL